MKIINFTMALAFSLTLTVGMGSKSKPETPREDPKVIPESTRPSAPEHQSVKLIENTTEDNQKVEKDLAKPAANSDSPAVSKKPENVKNSKKSKAAPSKVKKAAPAKKSTTNSSKKVQKK